MSGRGLLDLVYSMADVLALVVGDHMTDKYEYGHVERICPEAPVPVFIPERVETVQGGAGHVAAQIAALCLEPRTCFGPTTSIKTRYMSGSHMMLRVDNDAVGAPYTDEQRLRVFYAMTSGPVQVVVLSDYNKGWLEHGFCKEVIRWAAERKIPVVVDPKADWWQFKGASVICPNQKEFGEGIVAGAFIRAGTAVIEKRGAQGIRLHRQDSVQHFPATARHVYNVTGAGDTVVAVIAAALAAGGSLEQAAVLANLAAGHCVGEVGTTVCSRETLIKLVKEIK